MKMNFSQISTLTKSNITNTFKLHFNTLQNNEQFTSFQYYLMYFWLMFYNNFKEELYYTKIIVSTSMFTFIVFSIIVAILDALYFKFTGKIHTSSSKSRLDVMDEKLKEIYKEIYNKLTDLSEKVKEQEKINKKLQKNFKDNFDSIVYLNELSDTDSEEIVKLIDTVDDFEKKFDYINKSLNLHREALMKFKKDIKNLEDSNKDKSPDYSLMYKQTPTYKTTNSDFLSDHPKLKENYELFCSKYNRESSSKESDSNKTNSDNESSDKTEDTEDTEDYNSDSDKKSEYDYDLIKDIDPLKLEHKDESEHNSEGNDSNDSEENSEESKSQESKSQESDSEPVKKSCTLKKYKRGYIVYGDTRPNKESLKECNGKYNRSLKAWVYRKADLEQVKKLDFIKDKSNKEYNK